jgi:AAHS family 4-hydroxybenzoate transporter-like MFS transporter
MAAVDVGSLLDQGEWGRVQKLLVALVASTIVIDGIDNQLLGVAVPSIMRDWSVLRSAFAPVLATSMFGMMLGGAIAGLVGDRFGRKVALLGSVAVFGVLTLAASFATGLTMLMTLRFLAALGLGGAMPNAAALSSEFVPRRHRAFAVTLTIVCVPLGGMLAAVLAEYVLPTFGWRALFMIGGVLPLVLGAALVGLLPESPRYLARRPARWSELTRVLNRFGHDLRSDSAFVDATEKATGRVPIAAIFAPAFRRDTLALCGAFFSCLLAVYTCFNWVPSLLAGAGLGAYSSRGILVFNLGGVLGAISGAAVISRLGSRLTMISMAIGAVVAALALAATPIVAGAAPLPIIALLGVAGCLINAVQTTMFALAAHVYPTSVRATGVGTAVAIGRAGGVASTYAGEWVIAAGGTAWFFGLVAAAMGIVSVALATVTGHIRGRGTPAKM